MATVGAVSTANCQKVNSADQDDVRSRHGALTSTVSNVLTTSLILKQCLAFLCISCVRGVQMLIMKHH
jgi:hypothetical protein